MHPVGFQLLELIASKQDVSPHIRSKVVLMGFESLKMPSSLLFCRSFTEQMKRAGRQTWEQHS